MCCASIPPCPRIRGLAGNLFVSTLNLASALFILQLFIGCWLRPSRNHIKTCWSFLDRGLMIGPKDIMILLSKSPSPFSWRFLKCSWSWTSVGSFLRAKFMFMSRLELQKSLREEDSYFPQGKSPFPWVHVSPYCSGVHARRSSCASVPAHNSSHVGVRVLPSSHVVVYVRVTILQDSCFLWHF